MKWIFVFALFFACAPAVRPASQFPAKIQGGLVPGDTRVAAPQRLLDDLAQFNHDSIELVFRVCLRTDGRPAFITLASPLGLPREVADLYVDKIRGWTFQPYSVTGHAIEGCDDAIFRQGRNAKDAMGEMAGRPHVSVLVAMVVDPRLRRDPHLDVKASAEVAREMQEHKLEAVDASFLVCYDPTGLADEVRLVGPPETSPGIIAMFQGWVGTRRQAQPMIVEGVPVRSCSVRTYHVVAS